jgi:hypothetical protein
VRTQGRGPTLPYTRPSLNVGDLIQAIERPTRFGSEAGLRSWANCRSNYTCLSGIRWTAFPKPATTRPRRSRLPDVLESRSFGARGSAPSAKRRLPVLGTTGKIQPVLVHEVMLEQGGSRSLSADASFLQRLRRRPGGGEARPKGAGRRRRTIRGRAAPASRPRTARRRTPARCSRPRRRGRRAR